MAEGGRTGLTSVVVGVLFLISIFLSPLAILISGPVTAAVLILIGFLMIGFIKDIDFTDLEEGFPALLAIILMPLTFSITVGIGAGFVIAHRDQGGQGKGGGDPDADVGRVRGVRDLLRPGPAHRLVQLANDRIEPGLPLRRRPRSFDSPTVLGLVEVSVVSGLRGSDAQPLLDRAVAETSTPSRSTDRVP